ncbi:hypothetical protein GJ496_003253 [Pomphorhynchus laevis]|nr:hypothetical protein GJ496_003253 [Pomphorhynchus laevis]
MKGCICPVLRAQLLLITTMTGVISGIIIGIVLRQYKCPQFTTEETKCLITRDAVFYLKFPGEILISLLKLIILPLIMTSMIASLCRMSSETSGKLGGLTFLMFIVTTFVSVIVAGTFTLLMKPGQRKIYESDNNNTLEARALDTILDIFRNVFPSNLVQATFQTANTMIGRKIEKFQNDTNKSIDILTITRVTKMRDGMNALGIISFSITFGAILSQMGPKSAILKDLNDVIMDVVMVMVKIIIWYSPIGIFFLLLAKMVEIDDLAALWSSLGMYIVADILASLVQALIVLPILTFLIIRQNPFKYYYHFLQALVTAFATASSGATLGISFQCAEEKAKIDKRISRFVLPLGATVHMDGTAIYEMCSAIFLAQLTGVQLNAGKIIVAGIMSSLAAVSSAGIPQGAIVNLVMVLDAIGVSSAEISTLYATDWLLDRVRTALNVLGDCLCCVVLQKVLQEDLRRLDESNFGKEELSESSDTVFTIPDEIANPIL